MDNWALQDDKARHPKKLDIQPNTRTKKPQGRKLGRRVRAYRNLHLSRASHALQAQPPTSDSKVAITSCATNLTWLGHTESLHAQGLSCALGHAPIYWDHSFRPFKKTLCGV